LFDIGGLNDILGHRKRVMEWRERKAYVKNETMEVFKKLRARPRCVKVPLMKSMMLLEKSPAYFLVMSHNLAMELVSSILLDYLQKRGETI
jgi:hypothetical protein